MRGTRVPPRKREVANAEKRVPREWINEAGNFVTEQFIRYATPRSRAKSKSPSKTPSRGAPA